MSHFCLLQVTLECSSMTCSCLEPRACLALPLTYYCFDKLRNWINPVKITQPMISNCFKNIKGLKTYEVHFLLTASRYVRK